MKIGAITKYDLDNSTVTVVYNADEVGDTSVPETYLEVTGLDNSIVSAVGYVLKDSAGIPMKFADIAGLDTAEDITKDGIYLIMSGSLEKLEITCDGSCHLVVKQVL